MWLLSLALMRSLDVLVVPLLSGSTCQWHDFFQLNCSIRGFLVPRFLLDCLFAHSMRLEFHSLTPPTPLTQVTHITP